MVSVPGWLLIDQTMFFRFHAHDHCVAVAKLKTSPGLKAMDAFSLEPGWAEDVRTGARNWKVLRTSHGSQ
jgi:hypothetical protein